MSEPVTEAGKALLIRADTPTLKDRTMLGTILRIEAEAARGERERLRARADWARWDPFRHTLSSEAEREARRLVDALLAELPDD